jgi:multiple sugar transport system substrate-binding protein
MKMRLSKVLVLSAAAAATLATVGAVSAQSGKVQIDFWAHWLSEIRRPTINRIVSDFNKANPGIQVVYTGVPFDQIIPKTLAQVAAGNPPCVVVLAGAETKIRASKNQLTNLTSLGVDLGTAKYFPSAYATGTFNGAQYALPFVTDTRLLYYNTDHFREAGLDPAKPPRTWAELEAYDAKLTKKDANGNVTRIGFHPILGGEANLELWANNAGAMFFDAQGNPQVNTTAVVNTLQWFKDWAEKYGGLSKFNAFRAGFGGGGGPTDPFAQGKISMAVKNSPYVTELARNAPNVKYAVAPIPTPSGKQNANASAGGIFNVEIPRGCKNPKEALAFAKFMTTTGGAIWAPQQNDFPAAKAAVAALTKANPNAIKIANNVQNTKIGVAPTYAPAYGTVIQKAQDDVLISNKAPKAALDEAQAALEKMVAENKK